MTERSFPVPSIYWSLNKLTALSIYDPNMPGTEAGFVFYSSKHVANIIYDQLKD
ncbi:hypothetical protein [Lactobacillus apis]|uniref:hypothetical protein n=1 Tax=Lactobacillus apis TaxID=303541 RepID=UPI00242A7C5D|nr:hypothetical protein [Lactobacillus apis]